MDYSHLIQQFYDKNQDKLENEWLEYVANEEWGSGGDRIRITDKMFWDFVEKKFDESDKK